MRCGYKDVPEMSCEICYNEKKCNNRNEEERATKTPSPSWGQILRVSDGVAGFQKRSSLVRKGGERGKSEAPEKVVSEQVAFPLNYLIVLDSDSTYVMFSTFMGV